ncbi:BgTH12-04472 [Blumeria graminis f. sp. triticale]|uniref:Bgt-51365 n=2 Tax=Blumeria graminis TaxID=34373 RepID=A0A9X9PQF8_BLUGR|nr:BgTH12-04472 [Blumeria graminis f. sp. triticale]VCU38918.1 Bgt-51365 [Blumeria graminis f. sp. tritici]
MKTFLIPSINAGLNFLQQTVADQYISCGIGSISRNSILLVAKDMWNMSLGSYPSYHESFPVEYCQSSEGMTRRFPILYSSEKWNSGGYYYLVESSQNRKFIRLHYHGISTQECFVPGV